MKRILLVVLTVALVAALGVTGYSRLYSPSTRPILNGAPLVLPYKLEKMSAAPLSSQPPPDERRYSAALRDAVSTIEPEFRIDAEESYIRRNGYDWVMLRKRASGYLDAFGFSQTTESRADVAGQTVDYLVWRPTWLHSVFDDRIVLAVALRDPRPDPATMVFGYFVLRPR
ncbi:Uncharacterised protein [Mycolicibacterium aurum]|uniref:Uncharacterized protein n=1 Tax=Mycolicibacterium aurum TaxID=1791 RepID=A0A3S4VS42_MYCAU|nr:hypothetical protein [Mycolicibacterium aurum]VEG57489.1 Uncharacterised protein [Mycolicibacterium aurum]